ncbi:MULTISPECIES: hypothetical protein [unclassified Lysobacter]|uniref:hypothetical protein n=1 Tax=unclassified Lysobacter TaxID=2635362 RepID=UPI001BEBC497|nr:MULTISPECIES: hypothetical protein [unclassified Lysobacter]MBT2748329.1 hypothetical protein [Lysobacter sp. ISL-42]MBT2749904.1 hypothetical protein [Lysobacter sp. ISL-50]MBT2781232.1 hypothetical protein [Lysobacter sp. ISL-52]
MNKTPLLLAAAIGAILASSAMYLITDRKAESSDATGTSSPPSVATATSSPMAAATIAQPKTLGPLPALDQPFRATVASLRSRAAQGDTGAACRLAAEFSYCQELTLKRFQHQRWLSDRELSMNSLSDPALRSQAAKLIENEMTFRDQRLTKYEDHCADIPPPTVAQSIEMWRRAAALGSVPAMKQYASGNAFRWDSVLDALPQLQAYRREAEGIAKRAASAGDLEMMIQLASAYAPVPNAQRSLLGQSVRPSAPYSLAIYRHVQNAIGTRTGNDVDRVSRMVSARIAELESSMDPNALALSKSISDSELKAWATPDVTHSERSSVRPDNPSQISLESCGPT